MKKLISLVGLFIIFNLPFACNPCGPFDTRPYKIVSVSSEIGSIDNGLFDELISTDFANAAIRAKIDETVRLGFRNNKGFNFSNAVYACSPPDPNIQRLTFIAITSDKNLFFNGVEVVAGESLVSIFKMYNFDETGLTVEEFNESPNSYRRWFGFKDDDILFQLVAKPDSIIAQKFTFSFTFDDGLEYQVLTPVFTVE